RARAVSNPRPPLAPVTTAVRPARLGMSAVVHVICEWMFIQFATSSNVTLDTPSLRDRGYGPAVPTIETATGPVDSAELGRVLMHEHVFIISPEMKDNVPEDWGSDEEQLDNAVHRLNELKAAGIDAILDPTALGLGRYIPRIAELADRIDLRIIVATGLYTFNELPHYWQGRIPGSGP